MIYYTENQIDDLRTVIGNKDAEIARLREALSAILYWHERGTVDESWFDEARAALAPVEVGK